MGNQFVTIKQGVELTLRTATVLSTVFGATPNSTFFVFAGRPIPWPNNDSSISVPSDSDHDNTIDIYQNMVFGVQINAKTVLPMASRHEWAANTVFTMYSDTDPNLYTENFFTVVNAVSQYHVFKCLDNNGGIPSIYSPTFGDTNSQDASYQTADGYVWKYLYTIPKSQFDLFSTPDFIPVIDNANTNGNAVSGAIDVITFQADPISNAILNGSGYNNYYEGQFVSSDIQVGGNNLIFGIGNTASTTNGFYTNCIIYITGGTGAGQYKNVSSYRVVSNIKEILVDTAFITPPDATSTYQISPSVQVYGDSDSVTVNCVARALVNAFSSNGLYKIDVLQRGAGYRIATANVNFDPSVGVTNAASLEVIIPPPGGHGSNAYMELGASQLGISVQFANNAGNTIPTQNDYRVVGIIANPLFANVLVNMVGTDGNPGSNGGNFSFGEQVLQISPIYLSGVLAVNVSSNVVNGTFTNFTNQFDVNDYVLVQSGPTYFVSQVTSIASDTSMTVAENCPFTNTGANGALVNVNATGYVTGITVSSLNLTNVNGIVVSNQYIIGANSYTFANVISYQISGESKTFATYTQLNRYVGTVVSGSFTTDELVFDTAITSNAYFHSINNISNGVVNFFVTNQNGVFDIGDTIQGSNSGAQFAVSAAFSGDLVVDSGSVIYYNNQQAISRSDSQTEVIKTILIY